MNMSLDEYAILGSFFWFKMELYRVLSDAIAFSGYISFIVWGCFDLFQCGE